MSYTSHDNCIAFGSSGKKHLGVPLAALPTEPGPHTLECRRSRRGCCVQVQNRISQHRVHLGRPTRPKKHKTRQPVFLAAGSYFAGLRNRLQTQPPRTRNGALAAVTAATSRSADGELLLHNKRLANISVPIQRKNQIETNQNIVAQVPQNRARCLSLGSAGVWPSGRRYKATIYC
jgi:hypothetical protein